jgi:hypothetical protein
MLDILAGWTRLWGKQDKPHPEITYLLCTKRIKPLAKRLDCLEIICTYFWGYIGFMYMLMLVMYQVPYGDLGLLVLVRGMYTPESI